MSIERMISAASGVIESPDLWTRRLPAKFADRAPRLDFRDGELQWIVDGQAAPGACIDRVFEDAHGRRRPNSVEEIEWLASPEGRRELQGNDLVDAEVLYSLGRVWDAIQKTEDGAYIVACTQAYNDWLAEFCAADPERFIGIAKVPTSGAADAVAELRRAAGLGLKGAVLDAWPAGPDSPPAMEECGEFWETAAGLGMPLSIYRPLDGSREPELGLSAGLSPEFYNDLTTIIYANIPDRNPDIRFVSVAPNAGWAPAAYEQLSDTYMRTAALRKISLGDPDLAPSDYLRRFFWYVTQDDRTTLLNAGYFGDAHLIWGSFAFLPEASVWPNTRQLLERVSSGMSDEFVGRIASDNVARLYGLGAAQPFTPEEIKAYENYALL